MVTRSVRTNERTNGWTDSPKTQCLRRHYRVAKA